MTRLPHEPDRSSGNASDHARLPEPLDRLGREFARVAHDQAATRPWWRRLGSAWLLSLVAVLGASAVAVAAVSGVFGSPVSDPPGTPRPEPTVGTGVPRAGTQALTALRVADPAGGAPWGMRLTKTTREQGCVQVGRVVEGQLGVLGQDGQFQDDGRFHPLPLDVTDQQTCMPLDGAGHAFVAVNYRGLPASGRDGGCTGSDQPPAPTVPGSPEPRRLPRCARADERIALYGALGPEAVAVRYRDERGNQREARTAGPDGAYLVVTRPRAGQEVTGTFSPSASPSSGLLAVEYRDGTTCRIPNARRLGGGQACPKRGYVQPQARRVTATEVASPVTAHFEPGTRVIKTPGATSASPPTRVFHLRFTARVATHGPSDYLYSFTTSDAAQCQFGSMGGPVNRDLRAGEQVDQELYLPPKCTGLVTGEVRYVPQLGAAGTDGLRDGVLVGRFSAQP